MILLCIRVTRVFVETAVRCPWLSPGTGIEPKREPVRRQSEPRNKKKKKNKNVSGIFIFIKWKKKKTMNRHYCSRTYNEKSQSLSLGHTHTAPHLVHYHRYTVSIPGYAYTCVRSGRRLSFSRIFIYFKSALIGPEHVIRRFNIIIYLYGFFVFFFNGWRPVPVSSWRAGVVVNFYHYRYIYYFFFPNFTTRYDRTRGRHGAL